MPRYAKGKALPNTIVVKILELRADWIAKVPLLATRDAALKKLGSDWKKFQNFCGPSHIIDGRCNMSMDMYFKFIEASGMDYDAYWDSNANPDNFISHTNDGRANKNSNATVSNTDSVADSKPEKVYINVSKQKSTEESSKPKEVMPTNVVKFEKPVRKSVNSRLSNSSKPTPTVVRTVKYTDDRKIDHSSSAYVTLNSLEQKMNSFRIRLPIYMCALHISTDNVIADTDITYYRDIRDGKANIKLYEYIVLSEYLMKKYNACTNSEAKSTFKQIAAIFNDIYVQTLYFNDVDTTNTGK